MTDKHTSEPWSLREIDLDGCEVVDHRGQPVAALYREDGEDGSRMLEHARRIVACVNACKGIETEQLETDGIVFE